MKNRDVFALATALLAESGDRYAISDYEERAGFLLPSFCIEVRGLNDRLCDALGGTPYGEVPPYASLDGELPVKDVLVPAAAFYLAAMLVLAEDGELSDVLFARYANAVTELSGALPARLEPIRSRYAE